MMPGFSLGQSTDNGKISSDFEVKMIDDLSVSPNGKEAVFAAVGKVFILEKKGEPKEITKGKSEFEFEPSFSTDGKNIIFASWNESGYGKIHIYDRSTKWKKTALITSGIYRTPRFSPNGKMIVYKKEMELAKVDSVNQKTEGLYVLELDKGDPVKINAYGDEPQFDRRGKRIIYQSGTYRFGSFVKTFESVDLEGNDKKTLFFGKYGHEYCLSPNGQKVAWQELGRIYTASIPDNAVGISADNHNIDKREVSDLPGNNLSWSKDGKELSWTIANQLYKVDIEANEPPQKHQINLSYQSDTPEGVLAFTNARILTMDGDELIEHGTVIVRGNKIEAIGFDIQVPKEAHAINCSGKTIIPGLIDLNPSSNNYDYNLSPIQQWEFIELLRAGVTTKLDGGFKIANSLANRELVKAGKIVGPRLLNGGVTVAKIDTSLFSANSYEHYKNSNLLIAKAFGVTAIQTDVNLRLENILVLDNVQNDTSLVKNNDIHETILSKNREGRDALKLLNKYTLHNAKLIGMDDLIGSVEVGKIADFIVVDGNPIEDINNITKVTHTVINGRIYECATMEEVGNYRKRISRTPNSALYESLNRAMGSACCGFQH